MSRRPRDVTAGSANVNCGIEGSGIERAEPLRHDLIPVCEIK
jgi:hypothetical protein